MILGLCRVGCLLISKTSPSLRCLNTFFVAPHIDMPLLGVRSFLAMAILCLWFDEFSNTTLPSSFTTWVALEKYVQSETAFKLWGKRCKVRGYVQFLELPWMLVGSIYDSLSQFLHIPMGYWLWVGESGGKYLDSKAGTIWLMKETIS